METALRETHEELGIQPERVEVLGEFGPPELTLRGDMRVWPFVVSGTSLVAHLYRVNLMKEQGFVRPSSRKMIIFEDDPLPSIDLASLQSEVSQSEVAAAFHIPLSALTAPSRMRSHLFRDERPYTVLDVTDLVLAGTGDKVSITAASNEKGDFPGKKEGRIEVWGLTGWYLSLLMKTLQIYP